MRRVRHLGAGVSLVRLAAGPAATVAHEFWFEPAWSCVGRAVACCAWALRTYLCSQQIAHRDLRVDGPRPAAIPGLTRPTLPVSRFEASGDDRSPTPRVYDAASAQFEEYLFEVG
jgi:hypothetical protein